MKHFVLNSQRLDLGQALDTGIVGRVTGDESSSLQDWGDISQAMSFGELIDIANDLVWREVGERVLDSSTVRARSTDKGRIDLLGGNIVVQVDSLDMTLLGVRFGGAM